jgi:hypothetical protein
MHPDAGDPRSPGCKRSASTHPNPWTSRSIWFVPRKVLNSSVIAEVITGCAAGYSGWLGVVRSGAIFVSSLLRTLLVAAP